MIVVPHLPATCPRCYALCNPTEQRIALLVLKLISTEPMNDQVYFMPRRTPLCQEAKESIDGQRNSESPAGLGASGQ